MERKYKLLYVHGFASSGSSGTVMTLRRNLDAWSVIAPDLPVDPFEALELLRETVAKEAPDVLVGTSMGGMYAQQLWGVPRIIVNPSFEMSRSLLFGKMGRNRYTSKRKDGAVEFRIDKAVVERFKLMEKEQFCGVNEDERRLVTALFGDKDPVVNFQSLFASLYGAERSMIFNGEHRLNDEVVKKVLLPLLKQYENGGEDLYSF
ncbi:MAG: alpha/beta fold hydrolase [Bacteroidaceae bacterium]|nr:alpha/beta fold hydrolase [Bacteroidaceae bacterium]